MLSPYSAQGFLEMTLAALVAFGSISLELAITYFSKSVSGTPAPPFSSDTSLTHPLLFQRERKTEGWQGGLPPVLQWAGRSPPWGPARPRNPDNCR